QNPGNIFKVPACYNIRMSGQIQPCANSLAPLKVLGIAASPRREGNTDLLLAQALRGAADAGAEVTTLTLCELDIAPCRHCDGCLKTGKCVIDDDMQMVYRKLRDLDRLVFASPIFFMGVTAQGKAMIDRCQALWALKYLLKIPVASIPGRNRKGLFLSAGGLSYEKEKLFSPARATVRAFFATLDIKYSAELLFPHVDRKGEIAQHPTALTDAFNAGLQLVGD
ncbi:MAG: flavodoxin family protein, partial [Dehalococcoidia bacterium]|nr:flavodoxin family protein [Dehalococcoidia bacterium]